MARALYAPRATRTDTGEDAHELADELSALGASADQLEALRAAEEQRTARDAIEVHDDNLETVLLFEALGSQWRFAGLQGVRVGLDYSAIEPVARMLGIEVPPVRFQEIRLMEQVARREIAKAAPRAPKPSRSGRRSRR